MDFIEAIGSNDIKRVREILELKIVDVNAKYEGRTALMYASEEGYTEIVDLLLRVKADPNIQDNEGLTALMFAGGGHQTEIVNLLLKAGANPNIQDEEGRTALNVNRLEEIVDLLLRAKADPNIKDEEGKTALMYASEEEDIDIVDLLLIAKANPNIKDEEGKTALMYASEEGDIDIVDLLLRAKADPNLRDNEGNTALMYAIEVDQTESVDLLLRAGANPNIKNEDGRTPFMYAIEVGHIETVKEFLKYKLTIKHLNDALDYTKNKEIKQLIKDKLKRGREVVSILDDIKTDRRVYGGMRHIAMLQEPGERIMEYAGLEFDYGLGRITHPINIIEILNNLDINYKVEGDRILIYSKVDGNSKRMFLDIK